MNETAVQFCDLCSGYRGKEILHRLSGTIVSGAVTALIGPNGSGKSTFIKTLAGFLPYRGTLTLLGHSLHSLSRRRLGQTVSVTAQQTEFRSDFTVYEVISMGRLPHRSLLTSLSPQDSQEVLSAASLLEVDSLLCRSILELSGGERQRVLLAMAAAQNAPVCLFDEPTSAMDPSQSLRAFTFMRQLADSGKTVVVAAHDVNTALSYANFFMAFQNGHIAASGRTAEMSCNLLESLYGVPFVPYNSSRGDTVWHPVSKRS